MLANLHRLGARMDERGLDALIATTLENVHYLTGIESQPLRTHPHGGRACAIVTRDALARPYFVCSRCEVDQFLDAPGELGAAVGYGTFFREQAGGVALTAGEERLHEVLRASEGLGDAVAAVTDTLRRAGVDRGRIAVDEDGLRFGLLPALAAALPAADVVTGADVLRWTRKVKTPAEVERIAASAALTESGIRAAIAAAAPGVTERDLVREFDATVASGGGRPQFTLIKFGRTAVTGQIRPGGAPLRRGDSIWFDVGATLDGYWSDLARVVSVGEPAPKLARYYAAMLAGEQAALDAARPGMSGGELFALTVATVRESGVPHYRRQHVGHGIGSEVYEPVLVTPGNADPLEAGVVVNIETPYYEFGFGAVHVEDPFLVTPHGNRLLTTLDRDLTVV